MASFPQNQSFQQFLHQNPSQQKQSNHIRDFYESNKMDGAQISSKHQLTSYFNSNNNNPNLLDHHPPCIPPLSGLGLGQGPDNEEHNGLDLQWIESKKKTRPMEQLFLENNMTLNGNSTKNNNNSQLSDLLQARSVSTGLGLSLENKTRLASSDDSGLAGLIGNSLEQELQRQDAEIDRYLKIQGDHLRQAIMEQFQENQLQIISHLEEKVAQILLEKGAEIEDTNKKNLELELQLERLTMEAKAWEQRAKYNESMINTLKNNLQQVYAQSGRGSKEGCGDSEVDDTASCSNGRSMYFHGNARTKELMTCKVCRVNRVCMILLPCKHLCLCKDCESKLSFCPLCHSSKDIGMEVYM